MYWAGRKAKERGITREEILQEWDEKRDRAAAEGSNVHEAIEALHVTGEIVKPMNARCTSLIQSWLKWWQIAGPHCDPVGSEIRLFDLELGLAGTFDQAYQIRGDLYVFDWKTNEKLETRGGYRTLNIPFHMLMENEFSVYSIQVSLYRYILERHGINTRDGYLVHITPDGCEKHRCYDLRHVFKNHPEIFEELKTVA